MIYWLTSDGTDMIDEEPKYVSSSSEQYFLKIQIISVS